MVIEVQVRTLQVVVMQVEVRLVQVAANASMLRVWQTVSSCRCLAAHCKAQSN